MLDQPVEVLFFVWKIRILIIFFRKNNPIIPSAWCKKFLMMGIPALLKANSMHICRQTKILEIYFLIKLKLKLDLNLSAFVFYHSVLFSIFLKRRKWLHYHKSPFQRRFKRFRNQPVWWEEILWYLAWWEWVHQSERTHPGRFRHA